MKTATEHISAALLVGDEKAVELIAKAGFDAWDYSICDVLDKQLETKTPKEASAYCLSLAKKLRQIGLDNGIVCNQSHAPFPVTNPIYRDALKMSIECTAVAGGNICVIHPDNNKSAEENAEMYLELLPFAKEHNVKIATENMWNWNKELDMSSPAACSSPEDFVKHIRAVNDDYFIACLDIGHCEMKGVNTNAPEMIHALGSSLQALHLHDNDKHHDSHQIPFSMAIDFKKVVLALKEINYSGYFTLEANSFLRNYDPNKTFDGLKELYASCRKLADMFENS